MIHLFIRPHRKFREEGQSLLEFALVFAFVIVPITFALIEASILLYKYVALTNAAREGARAGSIYLHSDPIPDLGNVPLTTIETTRTTIDTGRNGAIAATVRGMVGPLIVPPSDCAATAGVTTCQVAYGTTSSTYEVLRSTAPFTVTLSHTHSYIFGALGGTIDLRAQASMRIEPSTIISTAGP